MTWDLATCEGRIVSVTPGPDGSVVLPSGRRVGPEEIELRRRLAERAVWMATLQRAREGR